MSGVTFANHGDVVNIDFGDSYYPYEQDDPRRPQSILQGRVITIDSVGVILASNGENIMPSFDPDRDELTLPARGDLFPWSAIKRLSFVRTGAQYEDDWRLLRAKESVYMESNDRQYPQSDQQYREWARNQYPEDLAQRITAAYDAEAPGD